MLLPITSGFGYTTHFPDLAFVTPCYVGGAIIHDAAPCPTAALGERPLQKVDKGTRARLWTVRAVSTLR